MKKIVSVLAIGGSLAFAGCAQPPAPAPPPAPVAAAAPAPAPVVAAATVALPGDMMGTGMRMGPPPGAGPGGPPPGPPGGMKEPGSDAPAPPMALALKAAEVAINTCKKQGFNIGVAVIGSDGQPRVGLSGNGASGGHIYTAVRKGLAALAFGVPSGQVDRNDPKVTPKMATMAGAIPLFSKGKVIGAIAGSGAASTKDAECAQAGADAIKNQL